MDVFGVMGFAFGMLGLVFGLQGMMSSHRINKLEERLKELNVIDPEFNSGAS